MGIDSLILIIYASFCQDFDTTKHITFVTGQYEWNGKSTGDTVFIDERFPAKYLKMLIYHECLHNVFLIPDSNEQNIMNTDFLYRRFKYKYIKPLLYEYNTEQNQGDNF